MMATSLALAAVCPGCALHDPARHDHVKGRALKLGVGGEGDPLAVDERHPYRADRAGEGQPGQLCRQRGRVDGDHVVEVLGVQRHHGRDDLHLVAQALDERRAQRPVGQAAGEDRVLRRPALAAEERAGDAAGRIHSLFHVHGEREEVEPFPGMSGCGRRRQDHRLVVQVGDSGTGGLAGEPTGLKTDLADAEPPVINNGFGAMHTLHGWDLLVSSESRAGPPASRGVLCQPPAGLRSKPSAHGASVLAATIREPLPRTGPGHAGSGLRDFFLCHILQLYRFELSSARWRGTANAAAPPPYPYLRKPRRSISWRYLAMSFFARYFSSRRRRPTSSSRPCLL